MVIYYTHSYGNTDGESHRLLQRAIAKYLSEEGCGENAAESESAALVGSMEKTGEYGKPVIPGFAPFSISHSNNSWAVLIADPGEKTESCGLDIQYGRRSNAESVSRRFFASEDAKLVTDTAAGDCGHDAAETVFFRLWTRREALVKAAGASVAGTDIPSVTGDEAFFAGTGYSLADVSIPGAELYAAVCTAGAMMPLRIAEL